VPSSISKIPSLWVAAILTVDLLPHQNVTQIPSRRSHWVVKHYDSPRLWPRRSGLPLGWTIGLLLGEELLDEIGDHRGAPGVLVHEIGGQLQPAAAGDAVE
jgi:hypothetical protein